MNPIHQLFSVVGWLCVFSRSHLMKFMCQCGAFRWRFQSARTSSSSSLSWDSTRIPSTASLSICSGNFLNFFTSHWINSSARESAEQSSTVANEWKLSQRKIKVFLGIALKKLRRVKSLSSSSVYSNQPRLSSAETETHCWLRKKI